MMLSMSCSEVSIPMEERAALSTFLATSSSPTISSRPGRCSSERALLSLIKEAHLANRKLSGTTCFSSGKCQLYHSFTRIANVLMSLSIWSSRAIDWMIMLSALLGLNFTFVREYECPSPNWACSSSPACRGLTKEVKWCLMPRMISRTVSSERQGTLRFSWMAVARVGSMTPRGCWVDFLPLGRAPSMKFLRSSVISWSVIALIFSSADSADSKGWKATIFTMRWNFDRSPMLFCTSCRREPTSSVSSTEKMAYPEADSNRI
mmetsp:Transcript_2827/g.6530  ORF Transcript_2827/g.6530 Transcript_2827/m.6530 type:complete len:263 (-) Transcript_2827:136-924(-)